MELLGEIVLLQVQATSLKATDGKHKWYDPEGIVELDVMVLADGGCLGIVSEEEAILDVHHPEHPLSKNRERTNGVSIGFTSHYDLIRDEYGEDLEDGIAGENILVERDETVVLPEIVHGLLIETDDGPVVLRSVSIAEPCVEFSKYLLGYEADQKPDAAVKATVQFLRNGVRGFYALAEGDGVIGVGDKVYALAEGE